MTWTRAKADAEYQHRDPVTKQMVGYDRSWLFDTHAKKQAESYISHLGLTSSDKVLIVGGAFGWSAEHLEAAGIETRVAEPSDEVATLKNTAPAYLSTATLIKEDSRNRDSRDRVAASFSAPISAVITEDLLPDLTDSEIAALLGRLDDYGAPVAHFVTCFAGTDFSRQKIDHPDLNWKTEAEWRALLPRSHIMIAAYGYRKI